MPFRLESSTVATRRPIPVSQRSKFSSAAPSWALWVSAEDAAYVAKKTPKVMRTTDNTWRTLYRLPTSTTPYKVVPEGASAMYAAVPSFRMRPAQSLSPHKAVVGGGQARKAKRGATGGGGGAIPPLN